MSEPIDPRDFGRLEAEVQQLQTQVSELGRKVDALLELANKGKGTFWAGMTFASLLGAVLSFVADKVLFR